MRTICTHICTLIILLFYSAFKTLPVMLTKLAICCCVLCAELKYDSFLLTGVLVCCSSLACLFLCGV